MCQVVIDKAVQAYLLARKRTALQKGKTGEPRVYLDRKAARQLAKEYPETFLMRKSGKYLDFIGASADDILEDYVESRGEKRGGKLWLRLAHKVISRGGRCE
jgi:hypothetical protein